MELEGRRRHPVTARSDPSNLRTLFAISIYLTAILNGAYLVGMAAALGATALVAIPVGLIVGIAAADLFIGVIHWTCDTWGDEGVGLIRAFREHHRNPDTILEHDWVEVNGEPAVAAVAGLILLSPLAWHLAHTGNTVGYAALWSFVTFTAGANQLHKWAHHPAPPRIVRLLQAYGLIISPEQHQRHHLAPHSDHYCISTGWLNRPLDAAGFWRRLERIIEHATGAVPRESQETK